MKKLAFIALPLVFIANGAMAGGLTPAEPVTGNVYVYGYVTPLCVLGAPSEANVNLDNLINTSGTNIGKIKSISDRTVTLPNSFCNFAGSSVSVDASALVTDSATAPANFSRAVNYTATASNWASTSTSVSTSADKDGVNPDASAAGASLDEPKIADISVVLSGFTVPSDYLLVSDSYSGQVIITLGPSATSEPIGRD